MISYKMQRLKEFPVYTYQIKLLINTEILKRRAEINFLQLLKMFVTTYRSSYIIGKRWAGLASDNRSYS